MNRQINISLPSSPDRSYPIHFVNGLREAMQQISAYAEGRPLYVVTDRHLAAFYGDDLRKGLCRRRPSNRIIIVPAGERTKSRRWKERIEDELLRRRAGRDAIIVAFGGGMVGDLAGFAASTLNRGVDYIQIPTSLLAQVDSSIGGKVAVNHPLGKNLIGVFYQPRAVYIAMPLLRTLPEAEYRNGLAEVIKYGASLDRRFFLQLEREREEILRRRNSPLTAAVRRCCLLKKAIVEKDERENGLRRLLNFGHTVGHAVELLSRYTIRHGEAVAIGMAAEARMSVRCGMLTNGEADRLTLLLRRYGLPTEIPASMPAPRIIEATLRDKKASRGLVSYTLLSAIGSAEAGISLAENDALHLLRA
jgi:3-dehydroquinate synthase